MKQTKIYAVDLEETAFEQFHDAMKQDFSVKGALMPDAHTGYSLPIGAVVAAKDTIVPAWVGYDIGCGMCALPTSFDFEEVMVNSGLIFKEIYRSIPVGFNKHKTESKSDSDISRLSDAAQKIFRKRGGFYSLGTLGGGNHFIEIGSDEDDKIWVIIHSGSRGIGHGIAGEYMKLASGTDKAKEGHFGFNINSDNGAMYINDMNWALEFALENRTHMMRQIVKVISINCKGRGDWDDLINRNHNHAEEKYGLWVHRKGATHAENGMMGVIPGNMRDGSFIVKGKGNHDSLCSSSHGAGRVMGRNQAKRELNTNDFIETMKGITAQVGDKTLDESPMAYKNIFEVMELQKDLVEVLHYIKPMINIKG